MNILQVFNGFAERWNANAYYALTLARGLRDCGHGVICVADPGAEFLVRAGQAGLETYALRVDTNNPLRFFPIVKQIRALIQKHAIDVINCHRGMVMPAYVRAARSSGRNVQVVRTHGEDRPPNAHFPARRMSRTIDKFITTTEGMRGLYVQRLGIPAHRIRVIYGGAAQEIDAARRPDGERQHARHPLVLGILGRQSKIKGHPEAIQAVHTAIARGGDVSLRIAGGMDAERHAVLRRLADGYGITDRVAVLGRVASVPEFIRSIDIGLVPSLGSEMICRVLMEFTAFGKPVLGFRVNSVGEVIEKFGLGFTSGPGDTDGLAADILKVANDGRLRAELAAASGRAYAKHFAPQAFTAQTAAFYQEETKPPRHEDTR